MEGNVTLHRMNNFEGTKSMHWYYRDCGYGASFGGVNLTIETDVLGSLAHITCIEY